MYKINEKRLINTFLDLVKIPSPSWDEKDVINFIILRLKSLNIKYKKYKCKDSYNIHAGLNGVKKNKSVLFSAHMDTVISGGKIIPIVTEKKISSDGNTILGSDDKSAISMFLEGLSFIKESKMDHGPVEILFTCAEETGLNGAKCFNMSNIKSKLAYVFDSSGKIGKIITKAPFHSTLKIKIIGKSAHAGIEPEKGINAINVISEIISHLPSGRIDDETTMNIGIITGGKATNIVADESECFLEIRSISNKKRLKHEKIVKDRVKQTALKYKARYKISGNLEYSGFSISKSEENIKIAVNAFKRINIKPQFEISGGGSDTNIFNKAGIKACNLACGMRNVHTYKEYINISDLIKGAQLMISIIESAPEG